MSVHECTNLRTYLSHTHIHTSLYSHHHCGAFQILVTTPNSSSGWLYGTSCTATEGPGLQPLHHGTCRDTVDWKGSSASIYKFSNNICGLLRCHRTSFLLCWAACKAVVARASMLLFVCVWVRNRERERILNSLLLSALRPHPSFS